jgi:carboxyl-terminal processing protease
MESDSLQPLKADHRILRWILIGFAAIWIALCLSAASAGVGFLIGQSSVAGSNEAFGPLYQAWDLIHSRYVHQPVDDTKLIQGAIDGMMKSLGDENSTYMDPATYQSASGSIEGYEGIGAVVDLTGEYLKIVSVFPESPAQKAGLKADDEIVQVDGVDMTGKDPAAVRDLLMGPAGSHIKIAVRRAGESELLEFDIVRAKINPPVVESRMLENGIAYISLAIFSDTSAFQVKDALSRLMEQNPKGMILDLRGNPGGLVTAAVDIGSQFLPEGTLLFYEKDGKGIETRHVSTGGGLAISIPLVVLVDGHSASAAEIISGALQDHHRATLVGMKTYGKGSVQEWIPLMNNMGAIRITVALWYTPSGRQIDGQGLLPDVEVPMTEEQFQAGQDPQLDRAVDLLS